MNKKWIPALLLPLVVLTGCSAFSKQDAAQTPAARPETLVVDGKTIYPGEFSQVLQVHFHPDGKVTVQEEFMGTHQFATWMAEYYDALSQAVGGDLQKAEVGDRTRYISQMEFPSVAALNENGSMEATLANSPLYYSLQVKASTAGYTAEKLAQVFDPPEGTLTDTEWGSYVLDAYHLKYVVTDERTGAQYNWERSAREIGSGQSVTFEHKSWRPLAWVVLGVAGTLLVLVTLAGTFGERLWAPRPE